MTSSLKAASAGIGLSIILVSFATVAWAGPKEEVAAAASTWAGALGEDDPDKVLPLYSDDAVLWGTLSPKVRSDRAALRDYATRIGSLNQHRWATRAQSREESVVD